MDDAPLRLKEQGDRYSDASMLERLQGRERENFLDEMESRGRISPRKDGMLKEFGQGVVYGGMGVMHGLLSTAEELGFGSGMRQWADDVMARNQQYAPYKGYSGFSLNPTDIARTVGTGAAQSVGSMAVGAGATIATGNPAVGTAAMTAFMFGQIYGDRVKEYRDVMQGVPDGQVKALALLSSVGESLIESYIGPEQAVVKLFGKSAGEKAVGAAVRGLVKKVGKDEALKMLGGGEATAELAKIVGKDVSDQVLGKAVKKLGQSGLERLATEAVKDFAHDGAKKSMASLLANAVKKVGKEAAIGYLTEGSEEVSQMYWNELVKAMGTHHLELPSWQEVAEEFSGGAWTGLFMGGGEQMLSSFMDRAADRRYATGEVRQMGEGEAVPEDAKPVEGAAATSPALSPEEQAARDARKSMAEKVATMSGMDVVWLTPEQIEAERQRRTERLEANGQATEEAANAPVGGWYHYDKERGKGTAYINPEDTRGVDFVIGHELYHDMMDSEHGKSSGIGQAVRRVIREAVKGKEKESLNPAAQKLYERIQNLYTEYKAGSEDFNQEFEADIWGHLFTDNEFMTDLGAELERRQQGLGVKFIEAIRDFVGRIIDAIKGDESPESSRLLNEYEQTREALAKLAADYTETNVKSVNGALQSLHDVLYRSGPAARDAEEAQREANKQAGHERAKEIAVEREQERERRNAEMAADEEQYAREQEAANAEKRKSAEERGKAAREKEAAANKAELDRLDKADAQERKDMAANNREGAELAEEQDRLRKGGREGRKMRGRTRNYQDARKKGVSVPNMTHPDGSKVPEGTIYAVVDAAKGGDIVTSYDGEGYDQALQNSDTGTQATELIGRHSDNPNAALMLGSDSTSQGIPVVDPDTGDVVIHNTGVMIRRMMAEKGTDKEYNEKLRETAKRLKVPFPKDARQPMLVAYLPEGMSRDEKIEQAKKGNLTTTRSVDAGQRAAADATLFATDDGQKVLSMLPDADSDRLVSEANSAFVKAAYSMLAKEDGDLVDGRPTDKFNDRLENAMMSLLFSGLKEEDRVRLVGDLVNDARNLGLADFKSALAVKAAKLNLIALKNKDFDLRPELSKATRDIVKWKRSGMKFAGDYANQLNFDPKDNMPEADKPLFLALGNASQVSSKAVRQVLDAYIDGARAELQGQTLIGDKVTKGTLMQRMADTSAEIISSRKYSLGGQDLKTAAKNDGIDLDKETQEFRDVYARYRDTKQWLKAPNGKDSKLTARQWVQVRTPSFKKWAGDWEAWAEGKEQRKANSISQAVEIIKSSGILNKPIENNKLGMTASISGKDLSKMESEKAARKSASPRLHALAIANVDKLFNNAYKEITHPDTKGRKEVTQTHRLGSLMLDPETNEFVPVMLTVFEYKKDGNKVYSIEAVDVQKYENSAGQLAAVANGERQAPIAEFINTISQHAKNVNSKGATKIIDENGEPLVVYHGTKSRFYEFTDVKMGKGGAKNNRDGNLYGNGYYFTDDYYSAQTYGRRVLECFLNIRNPSRTSTMGPENDGLMVNSGFHKTYLATSPTQIKSATDNIGTFSNENPDIRHSLTSKENDAAYMAAVEREDTKTAQKMVDEAAAAAGYTIKAYHGTPNGTFNVFRGWQYFTENKSYADIYQNQGASSNGYKSTAEKPRTYDVYLKVNKPFDTRNAAERKIFENEFLGKRGNGTPLTKRGLPDWTDGDDLVEFFEENGYDYDAIYLDEGATGGYGYEVKDRGVAIVIGNPEQIKSADPITYDEDGKVIPLSKRFNNRETDIRYSLTDAQKKAAEGMDIDLDKETQEFRDVFTRYQGTKQWMKAPNGSKTNLSLRQWVQVRTPSFKKWFGDWENDAQNTSSVIDENGEPMVVFHQTDNQFTVFDPLHKGRGSSDEQMPYGIFLKPTDNKIWEGGRQMPLFANIRKPITFMNRSQIWEWLSKNVPEYRDLKRQYDEQDREYKKQYDEACKEKIRLMGEMWKNGISRGEAHEKTRHLTEKILEEWEKFEHSSPIIAKMKFAIGGHLRKAGFDGIHLKDDAGSFGRHTEALVALSPVQVKSATDNVGAFSNEDPDIRYSLVSDKKINDEFKDDDKTIVTYRSALLGDDGRIYPPMATRGGEGMEMGKVYKSDEHPELRKKNGKFPLKGGMRDSGATGEVPAAYNPYFHSQPGVLNDQFSAAYDKSRMVTVKCRVLKSDIESGYQAEGAKDPVGYAEWATSGPVTRQMRGRGGRSVILSRYIMPVEIVPDVEVARMIKDYIGGQNVTVPWNVVPPNLRSELAKAGVKIGSEAEFRQAEERRKKRHSIGNLWTGSSADYDKPSLQYIGTGEGAQVFGWGLYATDNRGIAETYAEKDVEQKSTLLQRLHFNGHPFNVAFLQNSPLSNIIKAAVENSNSKEGAIEWLQNRLEQDSERGKQLDKLAISELENATVEKYDPTNRRNLYRQTWFLNRVKDGEANLLEWNEPLPQKELKRIYNILYKTMKTSGKAYEGLKDELADLSSLYADGTGEDVYANVKAYLGTPKAASEFLYNECGIDGIRYAANSFGLGDGSDGWNYVSFSDTNMRVDEHIRYSLRRNQSNPIISDGKVRADYQELLDNGRYTPEHVAEWEAGAVQWIRKVGGVENAVGLIVDGLEPSGKIGTMARRLVMESDTFKALPQETQIKVDLRNITQGTEWGREGAARRISSLTLDSLPKVKAVIDAIRSKLTPEQRDKMREDVLRDTGIDLDKLPDDIHQDREKLDHLITATLASKATTKDKLYEYWVNAILSAPMTHVANTVGNLANFAYELGVKRLAEAAVNHFAKRPDAARFSDFRAMWASVDWKNAWRSAVQAFNIEVLDASGKYVEGAAPAIEGKKGRIIRIPGRFLRAADEFAKAIIVPIETAAMADRLGRQQNLEGAELDAFIKRQLRDADSEAATYGRRRSLELTFQEDPGKIVTTLVALKNGDSRWATIVKYLFPFMKTPYNLLRQGIRKSPLGAISLLDEGVDILRGKRKADSDFIAHAAEQVVAWSLVGMALAMGGGDNDDEPPRLIGSSKGGAAGERMFRGQHVPAYSIRIGDKYYSYKRIEPLSTMLALIADGLESYRMAKTDAGASKALRQMFTGTARLIGEKSYLNTFSQIVQLFDEPERSIGSWTTDFAASWMPNAVRQASNAFDDVRRDPSVRTSGARWWKDQFHLTLSKAGVMRMAPKVDCFGRPITKDDAEKAGPGDILWRLLVPANTKSADAMDPAEKVIWNWNVRNLDEQYWPGVPNYRFSLDGVKYEMHGKNYADFSMESGRAAHRRILELINTGRIKTGNPREEDIALIKQALNVSRKLTRQKYVRLHRCDKVK